MNDVTKIKPTKAQKTFFSDFTKDALVNLLVAQTKPEYQVAVQDAATNILASADVSVLSDAVAEKFLGLVDYKTLVKVDKFLKSDEYVAATTASAVVMHAVGDELGDALRVLAEAVSEAVVSDEEVAEPVAE